MGAKTLPSFFTLALIACVIDSGADGAVTCETCSRSSTMVYYVTMYRQESNTRDSCTGSWWRRRCNPVTTYSATSSLQTKTRTVTSTYDCRCTTIPEPVQPTATSTSSSTATGTIPPSLSLSRTADASSSSGTATRTKPPVNTLSGTADAVNLPTASPSVSPATPPLNGSRVQIVGADAGSIAGTIIICLIVAIVVVAIIVVVVLGVYKYRTRSTKSSADINVATYYSAPGDGDTIQLEAHALVSPNPMYESLDVPTRHAYEEVHDFETKAVPNGIDDVALYSYVPPTVVRANKQDRAAVSWTEPGSYASLKDVLQQGGPPAYENVQYRPPADTVVELYDDLSRMRCIEIPRHTLRVGPVLGSGEFGVVHKGQWSTPEGSVVVALKMSHRDAPEAEKVKLLQETAIMKQFLHPNVVRLLGAVTLEEPLVLVMELLSNGDLRQLLKRLQQNHASLVDDNTPSLLLTFCGQIAEGMKYLAGKGFIHRDLAARNILLDYNQNCKISDFGLSRGLDENAYYMATGGKVPFRYTAPEALFYKKYSSHSDVWSYGMLLYEIWSLGEPPFKDLSLREVLEAMHEGRHDIVIQSPPPGCPRAIYAIMVDCWNLEYHSRPDFATIVDLLSVPSSPALLDIPQESLSCVANPQLATNLGAPMFSACDLYMDLQRKYSQ